MKKVDFNFDVDNMLRESLYISFNVDKIYEGIKGKDTIFERYCTYDGQYDDAHGIALKIVDMLENNETTFEGPWQFHDLSMYKNIKIILEINKGGQVGASVDNEGDTIIITIYLASMFALLSRIDPNAVLTRIEYQLSHELSHAHTDSKRFEKNTLKADPDWYTACVDILTDGTAKDGICRNFVCGLYMSYFHEIIAYASEVSKQIEWMITNSKNEHPDKNTLIDYLKETSAYRMYAVALNNDFPTLKEATPKEIEMIATVFDPYSKKVADDIRKHYRTYIKYIYGGLRKGLQKIRQNFNLIIEKYI